MNVKFIEYPLVWKKVKPDNNSRDMVIRWRIWCKLVTSKLLVVIIRRIISERLVYDCQSLTGIWLLCYIVVSHCCVTLLLDLSYKVLDMFQNVSSHEHYCTLDRFIREYSCYFEHVFLILLVQCYHVPALEVSSRNFLLENKTKLKIEFKIIQNLYRYKLRPLIRCK